MRYTYKFTLTDIQGGRAGGELLLLMFLDENHIIAINNGICG